MTLNEIKYLNNGTNGCVLQPAADCYHERSIPNNVSKIFLTSKNALMEKNEHDSIVSKVDPKNKFTVRLHDSCSVKKKSFDNRELAKCTNFYGKTLPDKVYQLVYDYGGVHLIEAQLKYGFDKLFYRMLPIFKGLVQMKKKHCIHLDIKPHNIVYNDDTKEMRLIDFGNSIVNGSVYNNNFIHYLNHVYPYYPLEFRISTLTNANDINHLEANWKRMFDYLGEYYNSCLSSDSKQFNHFYSLLYSFSHDFKIDRTSISKYIYFKNIDVLNEHLYSIDVYSFGVTIFELFITSLHMKQIILTKSNIDYYINVLYLIKNMTRPFPYERYTPEQALNTFEFIHKTYKKIYKDSKINQNKSNRATVAVKQCSEDKELNIATNRCRKKCREGYIRDQKSQRCVKKRS